MTMQAVEARRGQLKRILEHMRSCQHFPVLQFEQMSNKGAQNGHS
jgi:hypothetical protein